VTGSGLNLRSVRRRVSLEEEQQPGVVSLRGFAVATTTASVFIVAKPDADSVARVVGLAAEPGWNPATSATYERYATALKESDPALHLLALYQAAIIALTGSLKEPPQSVIDARLRQFDASIPLLPKDSRNKEETPFTRARNQIAHPLDRGVTVDEAKAYAAGQLTAFRRVVVALVRR
jgi:hypothetical protein